MLPFEELESITNDYFMADGKKAVDIYFYTSFLMNYLMKQQRGLWERPEGGEKIRIPLEYDGQESGFYKKGETISSDDRESLNAAYFEWKHAYGNATIYRIDELKNAGQYAQVQLVMQRLGGAQKTITHVLSQSMYDDITGDSARLTGLRACCNATTATAYGAIAEDDMVAKDGTKPWTGRRNTSAGPISLTMLRNMATQAKVRDGAFGKPNLFVMQETLWNVLVDILQVQQRYTDSSETVSAGFTGLRFEGKDVFPDDYCPAGFLFGVNSYHFGFAVHQNGLFMRTKWKVIPDSPEDRTMKIFWDGNAVCNNRKSMIANADVTTQ